MLPRFNRQSMEVVYAATGRDFVVEAAISAWSVKRHMPGVSISITTDENVECPHFDRVIQPDPGGSDFPTEKRAKLLKMQAIRASRARTILYLDTDTYVMSDLRGMAQYRNYDIAMTHDTWQFSEVYRTFNNGLPAVDAPAFLPFFNSGVIFIRRSLATMRLIGRWARDYAADDRIARDQLVLHDIVHQSRLRLLVLPPSFNVRAGEPIQLSGRSNIVHLHVKPDEAAWMWTHAFCADFLSLSERNRVFTPHDGRLCWIDEDFAIREAYLHEHRCTTEREEYLHPEIRFLD